MSMFIGFQFAKVDDADVLGSYEETKQVAQVDIVLWAPNRSAFYPLRSKCGSELYRTVEDFDDSTTAGTPTEMEGLVDDLRDTYEEAVSWMFGRESDDRSSGDFDSIRDSQEIDSGRESRESADCDNRLSVSAVDFNLVCGLAPDLDECESMFQFPDKCHARRSMHFGSAHVVEEEEEEDEELSEMRRRLRFLENEVEALSLPSFGGDAGSIPSPPTASNVSPTASSVSSEEEVVSVPAKPRFNFRGMIAGAARVGLSYCVRKKKQNVCVRPKKASTASSLSSL